MSEDPRPSKKLPKETRITDNTVVPEPIEFQKIQKKWKRHFDTIIEMFNDDADIDEEETERLQKDLEKSTTHGKMPSFQNAGARAGYTRTYLKRRGIHIGNLLLTSKMKEVCDFLSGKDNWKVISFGGGPGFDFIGIILVNICSIIFACSC